MTMLEIKKYPNSVLRKKSKEVKEITSETKKLVEDMMQVMEKEKGVGLAAPQVGVSERIIVVRAEEGPKVFINPQIIKKSKEKEIGEEGCLSFPHIFLKIKRAKEIEVAALNLQGEKIRVEVRDFLARVFQHEIDHLNGILLIDHISFYKKLWVLLKIWSKKVG
ncbi:MAG: peptide deformylase [bacterium]